MPQPVLLQHQDIGRPVTGEPVRRRASQRTRTNHDVAVSTSHATGIPRFGPAEGSRPRPAATAAPPTPTPVAVPSAPARFSDADGGPSPPGGAFRNIIGESG